MKIIVFSAILFFTCVLPSSAQVINYEIDSSFNSGLLFNKGVASDILPNNDGSYLIMGMFSSLTPPIISNSALIGNNGSLLHVANFAGSLVTHYKDHYLQYGSDINRFDIPFGVIYDQFKFEFNKQPYSGPLSTKVYDVIITPDENILAAGRFFTDSTLIGSSLVHEGLRQLCMIDSSGSPIPDFTMIRCAQPVDSEIFTVKQLSTGEYIVAGRFMEINGHATNSIAKLNPDFSVNTDFVSPLTTSTVAMLQYIDSQDRLWLFTEFGSLITDPNETLLNFRLLADGSVDESFNIPEFELEIDNWLHPSSYSRVLEDSDGTYILTGRFTHVNDTLRRGVVKIYENGFITGAFENMGADEATWGTWVAPYGPMLSPIDALPDGKILLGGRFSSFGGEPYSCLVRLQPSGYVGAINRNSTNGGLIIYPNPATETFSITIPDLPSDLFQIEIFDLMGKLVLGDKRVKMEEPINVKNLSRGYYAVKAYNTNGIYSGKLVKH